VNAVLKRKLLLPLVLCACPLLFAQQASAPVPAAQTAPAAPAKKTVIPDKFTNLTVLPTTIPKAQLMGIMRQLSVTTKLRCAGCHNVSDDLTEGDFASDGKPAKEDARKLIRMLLSVEAQAKP
jgi:hypothetical protein